MNSQEVAQTYAALCQELGHLYNNLRKIKARIAELEAQADALDRLAQPDPKTPEKKP